MNYCNDRKFVGSTPVDFSHSYNSSFLSFQYIKIMLLSQKQSSSEPFATHVISVGTKYCTQACDRVPLNMKINLPPLKMSLFCNTEYDICLVQHFLSVCFRRHVQLKEYLFHLSQICTTANKTISSTVSLCFGCVEERVIKTETFVEKKIISTYNFFV